MKYFLIAFLLATSALAGTEYTATGSPATGMDSSNAMSRYGHVMHQTTNGNMVMLYRFYSSGYQRMVTWNGTSFTTTVTPWDATNRANNGATIVGSFTGDTCWPVIASTKAMIRQVVGVTSDTLDTLQIEDGGGTAVDSVLFGNGGYGWLPLGGGRGLQWNRYESGTTDSTFASYSDSPLDGTVDYINLDKSAAVYNNLGKAVYGYAGLSGGAGLRPMAAVYNGDIGQDRLFAIDSAFGWDTLATTFMGQTYGHHQYVWDIIWVADSTWMYAVHKTEGFGDTLKTVRFKVAEVSGSLVLTKLDSNVVEVGMLQPGTAANDSIYRMAQPSLFRVIGRDTIGLFYDWRADTANYDSADVVVRLFSGSGATMGSRTVFYPAVNATKHSGLVTAPQLSVISGNIKPWIAYANGYNATLSNIILYTDNISAGSPATGIQPPWRGDVWRDDVWR